VPSVVDLGFEPSGVGLALGLFFGALHWGGYGGGSGVSVWETKFVAGLMIVLLLFLQKQNLAL
jgi:hypothetical protein